MPQSHAQIYLHLVFSTKLRKPFLRNEELRDELHAYIGGTCRDVESHVEALTKYIRNQKEHHRKETFQDEYRRLMKKYGIEWDENYVWQ